MAEWRVCWGYHAVTAWDSHSPFERMRIEIGSIDGTLHLVQCLRKGPAHFKIVDDLHGREVRCIPDDRLRPELERAEIADVWRGRRLRVIGELHFAKGCLQRIEASGIRWLQPSTTIARPEDISDLDFTGGVEPVAYVHAQEEPT